MNQNRPIFHFLPPSGSWINDPCAPYYDPATETFHLFFQYNPKYNDWGEIAWGHATSKAGPRALVDWEMDKELTLAPGPEKYDDKGIFTGGYIPHITQVGEKRTQTLAYTSVSHIPFNYTLPYPYGCETLSLAISQDDGATWQKHPSNPILPGPPVEGITGWRDPFIAEWPEIDLILDHPAGESLYGVIAGGTHDGGPNAYLYRIPRSDLTKWDYLGPLLPPLGRYYNLKNDKWSGDLGINMEVTNFFTFRDEASGIERTFLIFGSEGQKPIPGEEKDHLKRNGRGNATSLWMSGKLRQGGKGVKLDIISTGQSDHGLAYALNAFRSPLHGHPISYPWVKEEDLSDELRKVQGWSGCIGLPRKMGLWVKRDVVGCLGGGLDVLGGCWEVLQGAGNGTRAPVITLANAVVPGVLEVLKSSTYDKYDADCSILNGITPPATFVADRTENAYILESTITFPLDIFGSHKAGIIIGQNKDHTIETTLIFDPSTETFTIDRSRSLPSSMSASGINTRPENVPHTLLRFEEDGKMVQEALEITIIVDKSVVEVFLNGRTAVTTRIYSGYEAGCSGISVFSEGAAKFERLQVWDGLRCDVMMRKGD